MTDGWFSSRKGSCYIFFLLLESRWAVLVSVGLPIQMKVVGLVLSAWWGILRVVLHSKKFEVLSHFLVLGFFLLNINSHTQAAYLSYIKKNHFFCRKAAYNQCELSLSDQSTKSLIPRSNRVRVVGIGIYSGCILLKWHLSINEIRTLCTCWYLVCGRRRRERDVMRCQWYLGLFSSQQGIYIYGFAEKTLKQIFLGNWYNILKQSFETFNGEKKKVAPYCHVIEKSIKEVPNY